MPFATTFFRQLEIADKAWRVVLKSLFWFGRLEEKAVPINPFLLRTPKDMLEKAKHDLLSMKNEPSAYSVFNFFVTAYHIMDYVRKTNAAPQAAIDAMYSDSDFAMCNTICNTAKHLQLDQKRNQPPPKVLTGGYNGGSALGLMGLGRSGLGVAPRSYLLCDGKEIDHVAVADRVTAKWEAFFAANSIT